MSQTSIIRESYSLHFCLLAGNLAGEKFARDFVHCRTASVFLSLGVVLLETSILLLIIWNDSGMPLENLSRYKRHYSGTIAMMRDATRLLRGLVGAWRFELQTSCAQDRLVAATSPVSVNQF